MTMTQYQLWMQLHERVFPSEACERRHLRDNLQRIQRGEIIYHAQTTIPTPQPPHQ